jgi:MYND finger
LNQPTHEGLYTLLKLFFNWHSLSLRKLGFPGNSPEGFPSINLSYAPVVTIIKYIDTVGLGLSPFSAAIYWNALNTLPNIIDKTKLEIILLYFISSKYVSAKCCMNFMKHFQNPGIQIGSKVCGNCRLARYCSPECQREDWKVHKKICPVLPQSFQQGHTEFCRHLAFEAPNLEPIVIKWLDMVAKEPWEKLASQVEAQNQPQEPALDPI